MKKTETRWGYWTVLAETPYMKIKELVINPLSSISLQLHNDRSEHWYIKNGYGILLTGWMAPDGSVGDIQTTFLQPDMQVEIQSSQVHKVIALNWFYPDDITTKLVITEIQRGQNLSEDDIVRLESI